MEIKQEILEEDEQEDPQNICDSTKQMTTYNVKNETLDNTLDVKISNIKSEHIMFKSEDETYQCRHCDYKTGSRKNILEHVQLHVDDNDVQSNSPSSRDTAGEDASGRSGSPVPRLFCNNCDYSCTSESHLTTHIATHAEKVMLVTKMRNYNTRETNRLKHHTIIHTTKQQGPSSTKYVKESAPIKVITTYSDRKAFECNHCAYRSKQKSALVIHLRKHTRENLFICAKCNFKCFSKTSLADHKIIHSREKPQPCDYKTTDTLTTTTTTTTTTTPTTTTTTTTTTTKTTNTTTTKHIKQRTGDKFAFACMYCEFKCSYKSRLTLHIRLHTGEKPYACKSCDYKCSQKSCLTRHIRQHTGEKPYSCNYCEYKCRQNSLLTKHLMLHTGEKPYSCSYCEYKCCQKSQLTSHIRLHTGEKRYACEFCEYKCSHKPHLTTHIRQHTGEKPYACNYCDYKSSDKSYLKKHIRIHTGEKPYACNYCDYKTSYKSHLATHQATHS